MMLLKITKRFTSSIWLGTDKKLLHWRIIAVVAGICGSLCALIFPLMPVTAKNITFGWSSSDQKTYNIHAPMITLVPETFSAIIPCDAAAHLTGHHGLLLGTLPGITASSIKLGLFVRADNTINITDRGIEILSADTQTAIKSRCNIAISSDYQHTRVEFVGYPIKTVTDISSGALRPQVVGLYTDLNNTQSHITATVKIDTRWETNPTVGKLSVAALGIILIVLSVFSLYKMDGTHIRKSLGYPNKRWLENIYRNITATDITVLTVLGIWVFLGSCTSDDGYIMTMAQMHSYSGYMVNFFRWWGASENPFGWYYNVLGLMASINTSTWFMRLPSFVIGLLTWIIISRFILPRLGRKVKNLPTARWSAAAGLLIIWLPLNNGVRPEPEVTFGTLVVWCLLEYAIATRTLFPIACAIFAAALTVGLAPGGTMAIAVLIVCSPQLLLRSRPRWQKEGILPIIIPLIAIGVSFLFIAFIDQPLKIVLDGIRAKTQAGPSLNWWQEAVRFYLLNRYHDVNGAANRRIGVYITFFSLIMIILVLVNRKYVRQIASGPAWRLVGITIGMLCAMVLTPTKWSHHFGVYASLTACLAGLCGTLLHPSVISNKALRSYLCGAILFLTAVSFGGINGWWFVSSYGVPWSDSAPSIGKVHFSTIILCLAVLMALRGLFYHCRPPHTNNDSASSEKSTVPAQFTNSVLSAPLAIVLSCILIFEIGSLSLGAYRQRHSFSWFESNITSFTNRNCSLANKVLVEPDANATLLVPAEPISAQHALYGKHPVGFSPLGIPENLQSEANPVDPITEDYIDQSSAASNQSTDPSIENDITSFEETLSPRVTAENLQLPFGLHSQTPMAGSYATKGIAHLRSSWYLLPPRTKQTPLITLSAVGKVRALTGKGDRKEGAILYLKYATRNNDNSISPLGKLYPIDPGPYQHWRNLRFVTHNIPTHANLVQLIVDTSPLTKGQWLAITPPRMPQLITANEFLGQNQVGLIDWLSVLAFPCQHQMRVRDGLVELPHYRIQPDYLSAQRLTNPWQSGHYGGPDGIIDTLFSAISIPTYLVNNWSLDWGNIQLLTLLRSGTKPHLSYKYTQHSGLWLPSPIRSSYN